MASLTGPEIILIVVVYFFISILPIILGYSLGKKRSIGGLDGFLFGFFLSYLGAVIVLLSRRAK